MTEKNRMFSFFTNFLNSHKKDKEFNMTNDMLKQKQQELKIININLENLKSSIQTYSMGVGLLNQEFNIVFNQNQEQIKYIDYIINNNLPYNENDFPIFDDLKLKELLSMNTTFVRSMVKEYIPESEANEIADLKAKLRAAKEENQKLKEEQIQNISANEIKTFITVFKEDLLKHLKQYGLDKFMDISISEYSLDVKLNHMEYKIDDNFKYLKQDEIQEKMDENVFRYEKLKEFFDLDIKNNECFLIFNQKNIDQITKAFSTFNSSFSLMEAKTNRFHDRKSEQPKNVINCVHFSLTLHAIDFSNRFYFN